MPVDFRRRVEAVITRLSPGEVVSYGDVAAEAGYPGAARGVGAVLAHSEGLPWWRVVYADGCLVAGHEAVQAARLAAEGVAVTDGRIANRPSRPGRSGGVPR